MEIITLTENNADDYIMFLADMYWDYDTKTDTGYVELRELQRHAVLNPTTNKWETKKST